MLQGGYTISKVAVPQIDQGVITYTLSLCCHSEELVNVANGDSVGYILTASIPPAGQQIDNALGPVYEQEMLVLCTGADINEYLHLPAQQINGDQLVYHLCSPLVYYPSSDNCTPTLDGQQCAPPYAEADFTAPYNAAQPLGPDNIIYLDANTGELSGMLNAAGVYMLAICVEEYRNGVLIGEIQLEYEVTINACTPKFQAAVLGEAADDRIRLRGCVGDTTVLTNGSTPADEITQVLWQLSFGTFDEWEPHVVFPEAGAYEGLLIINPDQNCADTALFEVIVHDYPTAGFLADYDSCVAGPVVFTDTSSGDSPLTYLWAFGNDREDSIANPSVNFDAPGTFAVSLTVSDENACATTVTNVIDYNPAPAVLVVAPDKNEGCTPVAVAFTNLSTPVDSTYNVSWNFEDGVSSNEINPVHNFMAAGVYDISLSIESPRGCLIDTVFEDLVTVHLPPTAGISILGNAPTSTAPKIQLQNSTPVPVSLAWQLNNELLRTTENNFLLTLPDTGWHRIQLVVIDDNYCQDSIVSEIYVKPTATFFLPNAFTPNGDGRNELFRGAGDIRYLSDFKLEVYNRAGEVVFRATDPQIGWDGRLRGRELPMGVYVWRMQYELDGDAPHHDTGTVLLTR